MPKKSLEKHKISIQLPSDLIEIIKRKVESSNSEFKTVEEYVEFVLRELIKDEEESTPAYTPEEEEEIKSRLKALGYL